MTNGELTIWFLSFSLHVRLSSYAVDRETSRILLHLHYFFFIDIKHIMTFYGVFPTKI